MSRTEGCSGLYPTKDELTAIIDESMDLAKENSQTVMEMLDEFPDIVGGSAKLLRKEVLEHITKDKDRDIVVGIPVREIQAAQEYLGHIRARIERRLKRRLNFFVLFPEVRIDDLKERRFEQMVNNVIRRHPLFQNDNWFRSEAVVRVDMEPLNADLTNNPVNFAISARFLHKSDSHYDAPSWEQLSKINDPDVSYDTFAIGIHFTCDLSSKGNIISPELYLYIEPKSKIDDMYNRITYIDFAYCLPCPAYWLDKDGTKVLRENASLYSNISLGKREFPWEETK